MVFSKPIPLLFNPDTSHSVPFLTLHFLWNGNLTHACCCHLCCKSQLSLLCWVSFCWVSLYRMSWRQAVAFEFLNWHQPQSLTNDQPRWEGRFWAQCCKTFYVRNLQMSVISKSICPWQAFAGKAKSLP